MKEYDTFDDYTILLVQFGYVACFSMVFPLVPLLSLMNAVVQIRMDAHKLCTRQRPIAEKSGSIGVSNQTLVSLLRFTASLKPPTINRQVWDNVLQLMIVCAVMTNCTMIGVTSLQLRVHFPGLTSMQRGLIMIVAEHLLLFVGYLMQVIFPRIPPSVQRALARDRLSQSLFERDRKSNDRNKEDGSKKSNERRRSTTNDTSFQPRYQNRLGMARLDTINPL